MTHISLSELFNNARISTALAFTLLVALVGMYILVEPTVTRSQVYDQVVVSQSVSSEISFLTDASNVTMDTTIPGITGGTANGASQLRVYTNNAEGYTMTIAATGSPAMQGNKQGGSIQDYTPTVAGTPDFTHSVGANTAEFAYTVSASTTSDLAQKFLDNGAACNTGSSDTSGSASCWYGLSTTATSTIVRNSETTASGATTTVFFRTQITASPVPSIPEDTYTATTTFTATAN